MKEVTVESPHAPMHLGVSTAGVEVSRTPPVMNEGAEVNYPLLDEIPGRWQVGHPPPYLGNSGDPKYHPIPPRLREPRACICAVNGESIPDDGLCLECGGWGWVVNEETMEGAWFECKWPCGGVFHHTLDAEASRTPSVTTEGGEDEEGEEVNEPLTDVTEDAGAAVFLLDDI